MLREVTVGQHQRTAVQIEGPGAKKLGKTQHFVPIIGEMDNETAEGGSLGRLPVTNCMVNRADAGH